MCATTAAALSSTVVSVGADFNALFEGADPAVATNVAGFARASAAIDAEARRPMVRHRRLQWAAPREPRS
jgi:hypothetical protein